jgi:hypothetical protein
MKDAVPSKEGNRRMFRRMVIMLVAVGLVFAAVFGFEAFRAR